MNEAESETVNLAEVRGLFSYPIPIDNGCDANVMVPRDLTKDEARRIYGVLLSLCIDASVRVDPDNSICSSSL